MIELRQGDILKAKADILVNTVNCVGAMGRGIALQFKKALPDVFKAYEVVCKRGELKPGMVLVHDLNRLEQPHYVVSLPTKKHWRGTSRMEYVESGLKALVAEVRRRGATSVAVPPLGCGLGGLNWEFVRPLIERAFQELPDVHVLLFEPKGTPSAEEMAKSEKTPNMTEEAFLQDHPKVHERFDRAVRLIKGFETPFGMELLATVHWVARYEEATDPDKAIEKAYAWNRRKRMFKEQHIRIAWDVLDREGWLPLASNGRQ